MGFRNPATSVAAVDTGSGRLADPGVRILTDTTYPGNPQGIVEWRTGLMDRNARATLSGGASGGSAFTVDGGASMGLNAPVLKLDVESAAAGGYQSVARIDSADAFLLNGKQLAAVGAGWTVDLTNGTYNAAAATGTYGTLPFTTPAITVPAGYALDVEFRAPVVFVSPGAELAVRLLFNGAVADGIDLLNPSAATMRLPVRLGESAGGGGVVNVAVQAWAVTGSSTVQASAGAPVTLRHRIY